MSNQAAQQMTAETKTVNTTVVKCDGGEGALGHPTVYLNMGAAGQVECPYCDCVFILRGGPADTGTE